MQEVIFTSRNKHQFEAISAFFITYLGSFLMIRFVEGNQFCSPMIHLMHHFEKASRVSDHDNCHLKFSSHQVTGACSIYWALCLNLKGRLHDLRSRPASPPSSTTWPSLALHPSLFASACGSGQNGVCKENEKACTPQVVQVACTTPFRYLVNSV